MNRFLESKILWTPERKRRRILQVRNFRSISMPFLCALSALGLAASMAQAESAKGPSAFQVKHVYAGGVYIEGGESAGLTLGQKLVIKRTKEPGDEPEIIAEIQIESITPTSAAGKLIAERSKVVPGDIASITDEPDDKSGKRQPSQNAQGPVQVASSAAFRSLQPTTGKNRAKSSLYEINRIHGRFGADFNGLREPGGGNSYSQLGVVLRIDATRLGGSHWKISGYHRGRIQSRKSGTQQQTMTDLINRTYHLSLTYENPSSHWVAGAGRLYVPWAGSLSTIDGFYLGRRHGKTTMGIFGGTTPNATSWNYDRNRQMAGAFINYEAGSFESVKFTSTSGIALSRIHWKPDRQFGFFENGIFYRHFLSIYSNVEADLLRPPQNAGRNEVVLSRSYFTIRLQPHKAISFDINESYFRNTPTFDTRLIGTGLLDKYLFQGLSGGIRLSLPFRLGVYTNAGRSSRTGDAKASWNYLYGATARNILGSGMRADYRYSRFDSSFGRGTYQSFALDREVGEALRFEVQVGQQDLLSSWTGQNRARSANGSLDWFMGSRYFLGLGVSIYRGQVQKYNQYSCTFGYRFDNGGRRLEARADVK